MEFSDRFMLLIVLSLSYFLFSCQTSPQDTIDLSEGNGAGIRISKVFDHGAVSEDYSSGDGMVIYIETADTTILFDTAYKLTGLVSSLDNMEKMRLDPTKIDKVFMSHRHFYTTLNDYIGNYPDPKIYIPLGWTVSYLDEREADYEILETTPEMIAPGIYTTGSMPGVDPYTTSATDFYEQSLILDTPRGLIVLASCSHPGILAIVEKAESMFPDRPIAMLMGGFHLKSSENDEIQMVIDELMEKDIQYISTTHCTGGRGVDLFKEAYGERYVDFLTGVTVEF